MICLDCIHFKQQSIPSNQLQIYQVNGKEQVHQVVYGSCHKNPHLTEHEQLGNGLYVPVSEFKVKLKTHFTWHNHECAKWPVMYDARAIETCSGWITDRFTIEE